MSGETNRAWLDWWANSSTRLGTAEVDLQLGAVEGGGEARARLVADNPGALEEFELLCSLDPIFSLRFDDGTMVAVRVATTDDRVEVVLHEQDGPAALAFSARLDV